MRKINNYYLIVLITILLLLFIGLATIINCIMWLPINEQYDAKKVEAKLSDIASISKSDNTESHSIINTIITKDANNIEFLIVDYYPASYEIFANTINGKVFIEGSEKANSIYYQKQCKEIYYGGVGSYYGLIDDTWTDLLFGNKMNSKPTDCMVFNFEEEDDAPSLLSSGSDTPLPYVTTTYNNFTCIRDYYYFSTLKNFPDHVLPGTCGVVAVSMLLGYYNSMVLSGNKLIPDKTFVTANGTNNNFAKYLFDKWIWDGKSSIAEGTIMGVYSLGGKNPGFPMAAVENKVLINKYAKSIKFESYKNICSSWYPKTNTKKYINTGMPIIGTTTKYSMNNNKVETVFHNVIIYGYKDDRYLCHMGWSPNTTKYSEIILSNLSLHSYYGMEIV